VASELYKEREPTSVGAWGRMSLNMCMVLQKTCSGKSHYGFSCERKTAVFRPSKLPPLSTL
jgi:hypothetical protein